MVLCDQSDCKYCIKGSCAASVVKLKAWDVDTNTCLTCETYESRYREGKHETKEM